MLCPWRIYFYLIYGGSASRAFAEWQRETTLPESGSYSMGGARVKVGLRVLSVLGRLGLHPQIRGPIEIQDRPAGPLTLGRGQEVDRLG